MAATPCTRAIAPAWNGPTTACACCPPIMRIWPMGRPRRRHEPAAPEGRSLVAVRPGPGLFAPLLLVPLALTAVLSLNMFDPATGVKAGTFTLEHYAQVFTDGYYHAIFWRTFWMAALVTLICVLIGAPEAWILSRMGKPWRTILLLVVLAPLLVSVVVRAFGW